MKIIWIIDEDKETREMWETMEEPDSVLIETFESAFDCCCEKKGLPGPDGMIIDVGGISSGMGASIHALTSPVQSILCKWPNTPKVAVHSAIDDLARSVFDELRASCPAIEFKWFPSMDSFDAIKWIVLNERDGGLRGH